MENDIKQWMQLLIHVLVTVEAHPLCVFLVAFLFPRNTPALCTYTLWSLPILVAVTNWWKCYALCTHPIQVLGVVYNRLHTNLGAVNTLRPRQNGRHFADDIFKCIFLNENIWISIKISLKFVPKGPINNIRALVQIMAWRRPGDKPLFEAMMVNLPTHICVSRPQWVNSTP